MNNQKVIILLSLFLFCSCQNEQEKILLKKIFYKNGNLKEEVYKKGDTVFGRIYYDDGKVKQYIRTYNIDPTDSFLNGHSITYFKNGNTEFDFYYKRDKLNGTKKSYFPNGNISEVMNYREDIPYGMRVIYYADNKLKGISFRNKEGEVIYHRNYDKGGNIVKEEGFPLSESYSNFELAISDTLELFYRIGWLSGWEISLVIKEIKPNNGKIIMHVNDVDRFITNGWGKYIESYHSFKNKDSYIWETEITIFDTESNKELKHKDTFNFRVR